MFFSSKSAIALSTKLLSKEVALFDKLRIDSFNYLQTGTSTTFLTTYYLSNYSTKGISQEELCQKILANASKRDAYIATLIATMKADLKIYIKE